MRHLLVALAVLSLASVAHAQQVEPVRIKVVKVDGPTETSLVGREMRRRKAHLTICYDRSLSRDPKLRGTLTATFTVQPTGRVAAVRVEGIDNALENCAAQVMRTLRLPASTAASHVTIAIVLRPPPAPKLAPAQLESLFGAGTCGCPCPCTCNTLGAGLCSPDTARIGD